MLTKNTTPRLFTLQRMVELTTDLFKRESFQYKCHTHRDITETAYTAHRKFHSYISHVSQCALHVSQCVSHVLQCALHVSQCVLHVSQCASHVSQCALHVSLCASHVSQCASHVSQCASHVSQCVLPMYSETSLIRHNWEYQFYGGLAGLAD